MGGVEGPLTSCGFSCGAAAEMSRTYAPLKNPLDIGGPSTAPMLPRSAQDDKEGWTALALRALRGLWRAFDSDGALLPDLASRILNISRPQ